MLDEAELSYKASMLMASFGNGEEASKFWKKACELNYGRTVKDKKAEELEGQREWERVFGGSMDSEEVKERIKKAIDYEAEQTKNAQKSTKLLDNKRSKKSRQERQYRGHKHAR